VAADRQVSGEAIYTDDLPKRPNELVAVMVVSSVPHADILEIGNFLCIFSEI
jgi:xanthine dehydrogenase/oxidase